MRFPCQILLSISIDSIFSSLLTLELHFYFKRDRRSNLENDTNFVSFLNENKMSAEICVRREIVGKFLLFFSAKSKIEIASFCCRNQVLFSRVENKWRTSNTNALNVSVIRSCRFVYYNFFFFFIHDKPPKRQLNENSFRFIPDKLEKKQTKNPEKRVSNDYFVFGRNV